MWRPNDWDGAVLLENCDAHHAHYEDMTYLEIFEAGADAILEAIRKRGFVSGKSLNRLGPGLAGMDPKGKWYSIPGD